MFSETSVFGAEEEERTAREQNQVVGEAAQAGLSKRQVASMVLQ